MKKLEFADGVAIFIAISWLCILALLIRDSNLRKDLLTSQSGLETCQSQLSPQIELKQDIYFCEEVLDIQEEMITRFESSNGICQPRPIIMIGAPKE